MTWGSPDGPLIARVDWTRGNRALQLTVLYGQSTGVRMKLTAEMVKEAVQAVRWHYPILSKLGIEAGGDPGQAARHQMLPWDEWRAAFEDAGFVVVRVKETPFASDFHTLRLEPDRMPRAASPIFIPHETGGLPAEKEIEEVCPFCDGNGRLKIPARYRTEPKPGRKLTVEEARSMGFEDVPEHIRLID